MRPQDERHPWNPRGPIDVTGALFTVARYPPRGVIFLQGEPSDSVMHVAKGRVLLAVTKRNGKQAICGLLGTGAFLGEEAVVGDTVRRQDAIAMTATEVLVIAKPDMIRLLSTQPSVAERFIAHVLARNTRLEADLTDQLLYPAEQRLAHTLLALADCDERCPSQGVLPRISQEIIAEMVGTTRSRVNSFMGKFRKLGLIRNDGRALQVDLSRLRNMRDTDRELTGWHASNGANTTEVRA